MTAVALQETVKSDATEPSRAWDESAGDRVRARGAPSLLVGVPFRALREAAPVETERSGDRYWHVWPLSLFRRDC